MLKKIVIVLLSAFAALQFIRPKPNSDAAPNANDLVAHHPASPEVRRILESACYDCHSNRTRYPWYAYIQPVGWYLARHIDNGKKHLNFSEFAGYRPDSGARKLEHAIYEVQEGSMPLAYYALLHPDARLTPEQSKVFVAWAEATRQRVVAPPASAQP